MRKFWVIASHEYRRLVFSRQFLFGLLSVPLMAAALVGLIMLTEATGNDSNPIGYIDGSGILTEPTPESVRTNYSEPIEMIEFPNEAAAMRSLESRTIQAFYVIPVDYLETNRVEVVFKNTYPNEIDHQFADLLRANLLKETQFEVTGRALHGSNITVRLFDTGREFTGSPTFSQLLPFIVSSLLMFLIMVGASYLSQILSLEHENRLVEILAASVSSGQLITGKVAGIFGVIATQFTFWIGLAAGSIVIGRSLGYGWLDDITIELPVLLLIIGLLIPAFLLISGLVAAIGAVFPSAAAGQQIGGTFAMIIMLLMTLVPFVMQEPGGPVAVGMSLFPLSAPMTLPLRTVISEVPAWQIGASLTILVLSALFSVWAAGRVLQLRMRLHGKRLHMLDILKRRRPQARVS